MSDRILFVCTGNYYRSRFAEHLFNELSKSSGIDSNSFSKGLRLSKKNKGPISDYCKEYFKHNYPQISLDLRMPIPFEDADFSYYNHIIAMDETEHRPMFETRFADQKNKITYWNIADDYIQSPKEALPILEKKIIQFIEQLTKK